MTKSEQKSARFMASQLPYMYRFRSSQNVGVVQQLFLHTARRDGRKLREITFLTELEGRSCNVP